MVACLTCLLAKSIVDGFGYNGIPMRNSPLSSSFTSPNPKSTRLLLSSDNTNERMALGKGSYVALVTPMNEGGDVNFEALRSLLQWHVASGTDGLCILGTTAEATTLSMKERELILNVAMEEVKGKIPILCGTGTINPNSVKEQTQQAIDLGCDAALVVTPYYVKPPQRGLVKHFLSIADMGLPVLLYNVPGRTASNLVDESVALCSQHENIVGLKDATGDISRVSSIREKCGDNFLLLSGDDSSTVDFMANGGDGCISVTANLDPKKIHDIMSLCLEGKIDDARQLNANLEMLHDKLFVESNPIAPKWALSKLGRIPTPVCRPPLDELDPACYQIVEEAMRGAGLL